MSHDSLKTKWIAFLYVTHRVRGQKHVYYYVPIDKWNARYWWNTIINPATISSCVVFLVYMLGKQLNMFLMTGAQYYYYDLLFPIYIFRIQSRGMLTIQSSNHISRAFLFDSYQTNDFTIKLRTRHEMTEFNQKFIASVNHNSSAFFFTSCCIANSDCLFDRVYRNNLALFCKFLPRLATPFNQCQRVTQLLQWR